MFGSPFEQTNCKEASLKQLGNNEYRAGIRYYLGIIINFVGYDNYNFLNRYMLKYLYIRSYHAREVERCIRRFIIVFSEFVLFEIYSTKNLKILYITIKQNEVQPTNIFPLP